MGPEMLVILSLLACSGKQKNAEEVELAVEKEVWASLF